jgi:DNA-binding NtrC family response regulator
MSVGSTGAPAATQARTPALGLRLLLRADPTPEGSWHGQVSAFKRRLLDETLARTGGNRSAAARLLGLQRTYLLRLIRQFGLTAPTERRGR